MHEIQIKPFSYERPRFSRFGVHNSVRYSKQKNILAFQLKALRLPTCDTYFSLSLIFTITPPKNQTHKYPCKSDLDNYVKAFCDSANEILFTDDRYMVELNATKRYGDSDSIQFDLKAIDG